MRDPRVLLRALFFAVVLLAGAVAACQNPYPDGCHSFTYQTITCSDDGEPSCKGSLDFVIQDLEGDGVYDSELSTLQCSTSCVGGSRGGCPTCTSAPGIPVMINNPACEDGGGGGGSGCKDGDCPCGDGTCDGTCCSDYRRDLARSIERSRKENDVSTLFGWSILGGADGWVPPNYVASLPSRSVDRQAEIREQIENFRRWVRAAARAARSRKDIKSLMADRLTGTELRRFHTYDALLPHRFFDF